MNKVGGIRKSGKTGWVVKIHLTLSGELVRVRWLAKDSERVYHAVPSTLICIWPSGKESENVRRVDQGSVSRSNIRAVSRSSSFCQMWLCEKSAVVAGLH